MAKQGRGNCFNGQGGEVRERGNKDEQVRYGKATREKAGKEINM
jgi:hypothetical protein